MPLFARGVYALVSRWAASGGMRSGDVKGETEEGRERGRVGRRGELLAYWFLRRQGYTVIRRHYQAASKQGDIDMIAWDGDVLVFVEVKTRTGEKGNLPEESITFDQQHSMRGLARNYLKRRGWPDVRYRFDVVAVDAQSGKQPEVRVYQGAFGPA